MRLISIKQSISSGVTKPHYVTLSNSETYVLKFPGNPEREKALINEYIGYKLANLLNLPLLNFSVVFVDFSVIEGLTNLDDQVIKINGMAFATKYSRTVSHINNYKLINIANNKYDFIKILIFDLLIGNVDRNPGNLLYDQKQKKVLAIDHTHIFINGTLFRKIELDEMKNDPFNYNLLHRNQRKLFEDLNNMKCFDKLTLEQEILPFITFIRTIKWETILNIIKEAQNIWFFDEVDVLSLCDFIHTRFMRSNEVLNLIGLGGN